MATRFNPLILLIRVPVQNGRSSGVGCTLCWAVRARPYPHLLLSLLTNVCTERSRNGHFQPIQKQPFTPLFAIDLSDTHKTYQRFCQRDG